MSKTYSEARQAILFKASRDLRAVAAQVLDDVQNDAELASAETLRWAKSLAAATARKANELEDAGHEECIAPPRAETELYKARERYSRSIDAFEARIAARTTKALEA